MGSNEVKLFEGYLKLLEESKVAKENHDSTEVKIINAKMEGIIFAYEAYTDRAFDSLIKDWEWYNR